MKFDNDLAQDLLGKKLLIGITYLASNGEVDSLQQLHGTVTKVSETEGILISLEGVHDGKEWNMPPNTSSIVKAEPGVYKLNKTKEEVENPDYLCTWQVQMD